MPLERLQKIIAASGICSRRAAEELITAGRVRVNGPAVTELGAKADPEKDEILVDGKPLRRATQPVYLLLNKPRGCVTTMEDPEGRPTVMEFVKRIKERIYPVGRLDFHSEGLLLFTNDGDFANRILATGYGVNKTYWAKVHGTPSPEELQQLREGIMMDGRMTLPSEIRPLPQQGSGEDWREKGKKGKLTVKSRKPRRDADEDDDRDDGNPWFEVVLQEGRQNQIRRMFDMIGHSVRKLRRVRIGRLTLGTLKPGEFRHLTPAEVRQLASGEREAELKPTAAPKKRRSAADFRKSIAPSGPENEVNVLPSLAPLAPAAGESPRPAVREAIVNEERPLPRRPFERRPEPARHSEQPSGPRRGFVPQNYSRPRRDDAPRNSYGASSRPFPRRNDDGRRERPQGDSRPMRPPYDRGRGSGPARDGSRPFAPRPFNPSSIASSSKDARAPYRRPVREDAPPPRDRERFDGGNRTRPERPAYPRRDDRQSNGRPASDRPFGRPPSYRKDRPANRPPGSPSARPPRGPRPFSPLPQSDRPYNGPSRTGRPFSPAPRGNRPSNSRPFSERPRPENRGGMRSGERDRFPRGQNPRPPSRQDGATFPNGPKDKRARYGAPRERRPLPERS